ncbi:Smr/MutS family protein [Patiriisocius hiemis]|uniref:DNA mismatch repair protein MutS n=1 Tax=Patiriisocius hiemis TaxID=3075604 RepID=A0ABU2YAG0_9FLAO|nr:Smr/MutS family protein [Constantimarinum sp. W242]MDT0554997.1 DNA mismatch repair protein MutS [Constantimarinum sp. W242]
MKINDKVSVLDEDISGVVQKITEDTVSILTKDGFVMSYSKNELVVDKSYAIEKELINRDLEDVISEKEVPKRKKSYKVKPKERKLPPMEVDLHIHQLVNNQKGMSNYDMLTIQLDTAKRQLDFAIKKRIQKVVFVHGVGEGVLKAELEYLFRRYDNVKYYDADFKKYGRGATEVYIYQNIKN